MKKYFCCTTCPLECKLTVTVDENDNSFIAVAGNRCPRGEVFARQELVLPLRVLTTTVRLEGGRGATLLPVRSDRAFALKKHREAVQELRGVRCQAPVRMGDVIVEHIVGTDAAIIATRDSD